MTSITLFYWLVQYTKCNKNFQYILYSTDPRLLKHINPIWIPFHLLHRTRFTHSFVRSVTSLVSEGLPLQKIEFHIKNLRESHAKEIELQMSNILCGHSQEDGVSSHNIVSLLIKPMVLLLDALLLCFNKMKIYILHK